MKEKILVSSCLLGINCKYDGSNNRNEKLINYLKTLKEILLRLMIMEKNLY